MIYLDANGGTKPYPEVVQTIVDVLTDNWGNASSNYELGDKAKQLINCTTEQVAKDINCTPEEIIWTSGGCESNSLAISGVLGAHPYMYFLTSQLEHTSIYDIIKNNRSTPIYYIQNDFKGFINLDHLNRTLHNISSRCAGNFLVSLSAANSEIGTIQGIKTISRIVHSYGGLLHIDGTQLYAERSIDVQELGIDLLTTSGQKLHCCKGVGFLYVREGVKIKPLICGSQQNGLRGGTLPTHLIAAFGKALEITRKNNASDRVKMLTNKLYELLMEVPDVHLNGPDLGNWRLSNNISLVVDGVSAESIVAQCSLFGVYLNKGSACQAYNPEPSRTLMAIGLLKEEALSTIRISLDEFNTEEEVVEAAKIIKKVIERLRC